MSRPQVTITLGRSGQVVKRGGGSSAADFAQSNIDSGPEPRRKRHIERSADNAEDLFSSTNKRLRGDGFHWSSSGQRKNAYRVGQNDLRLKLMRKNQSKRIGIREEHSRMDLHHQLSKNSLPSSSGDVVNRRHEFRGSNLIRQTHSRESADDLYLEQQTERKSTVSYVDRLRARSPDGIVKRSMGLSPPRYNDEFRRTSSMREADRSRDEWLFRNSVADSYRSADSVPVKMKTALPVSGKAVKDLTPINGNMQRSSPMGEGSLSVANLLNSLGLGKYAIHFQAEEIDMTALRQMGDKDLKELGIPMGPRKKILLALLPRSKQPLPQSFSMARA